MKNWFLNWTRFLKRKVSSSWCYRTEGCSNGSREGQRFLKLCIKSFLYESLGHREGSEMWKALGCPSWRAPKLKLTYPCKVLNKSISISNSHFICCNIEIRRRNAVCWAVELVTSHKLSADTANWMGDRFIFHISHFIFGHRPVSPGA